MDQEVPTVLPSGNHLLGFGENKQPPWLKLGLALLSVLLVCGAAVFFVDRWVLKGISLPEQTPVLIAVRGQTELPEVLPRLWREAARATHLPLLLGLAKTENGWVPFAITSRFAGVSAPFRQAAGLAEVWSEQPLELKRQAEPWQLAKAAFSLCLHPAFLTADLGFFDNAQGRLVSGPVDGNSWRTDFSLPAGVAVNATDEDVVLDLAAFPEAWPAVISAMKVWGFEFDSLPRPEAIGWKYTDKARPDIRLDFSTPPATSTVLALAGSVGIFDISPYGLADNTQAEEMRLPLVYFQSMTSTQAQNPEWKSFWLKNENLVVSERSEAVPSTESCASGGLVFKLSRNAVNEIFKTLGIFGQASFNLEFHNTDNKLLVCKN